MAVDRTAELRALCRERDTRFSKIGGAQADKQLSPKVRFKSGTGEAFRLLSEQLLENLRHFALLLHANTGWLLDARNYDYSPKQRVEFEASCTKLLQGLLANLVALRDLAEWPRGSHHSAQRVQHRLVVVETLSSQIETLNQYLRTLLSTSSERKCSAKSHPCITKHAQRGTSSESVHVCNHASIPLREIAASNVSLEKKFQEETSREPSEREGIPAEAHGAQAMLLMQPPIFTWEQELTERDRIVRDVERNLIQVSELLHDFSVQVAQQDHVVESLLEDAFRSTEFAERANRELDRMRGADHSWHIVLTVIFLVMALSLLALDRLR
jgi:hypothetical protein